ncbi:MAG: hypothetical protein JNM07_08330 [Phycisphaerae bacterium]|nr:hypothetical protein [Phycisphaerae bacterium]
MNAPTSTTKHNAATPATKPDLPLMPRAFASFAQFFKGYMGVWAVVVAALPIPLTSIGAIPTYACHSKMLVTYATVFCFLLLGFLFYLRPLIARPVRAIFFPTAANDGSSWTRVASVLARVFWNAVPLVLILGALTCVWRYHAALSYSTRILQIAGDSRLGSLAVLSEEDRAGETGRVIIKLFAFLDRINECDEEYANAGLKVTSPSASVESVPQPARAQLALLRESAAELARELKVDPDTTSKADWFALHLAQAVETAPKPIADSPAVSPQDMDRLKHMSRVLRELIKRTEWGSDFYIVVLERELRKAVGHDPLLLASLRTEAARLRDGATPAPTSSDLQSFPPEAVILAMAPLNAIINSTEIILWYIGLFVSAEAAFILLALREYIQNVLCRSEFDILRGESVEMARLKATRAGSVVVIPRAAIPPVNPGDDAPGQLRAPTQASDHDLT